MNPLYKIFLKRVRNKMSKGDNERMKDYRMPEGLHVERDIPYINDSDKLHLLDIKYPENTAEKLPVIIEIHGGGLIYGDKELNRFYSAALAKRGFVVFSISYGLPAKSRLPDQVRDVMAAVKFINEIMHKYPCDPDRVYITGDSAGAYLSALACIAVKDTDTQRALSVSAVDINIRAIGLVCPMSTTQGDHRLLNYLRKIIFEKGYDKKPYFPFLEFATNPGFAKYFPPAYLLSCEEDELKLMSHHFNQLLEQFHIEHRFRFYPKNESAKLQHVFSVAYPESPTAREAIEEMCAFFLAH